jgi:tRNA modification GTPase
MAGDTIFALASARGKAGVAVVRLSGPRAHDAARVLAGSLAEPRRTALRKLHWRGDLLDEALVIAFAEGASFTGETSCELHLHGGTATVAAVLRALSAQPGLRLAEPGEFTRRALFNGQLDLAQVEGLADVIDAETEAQRRQALRVLSGAVGERVQGWRRNLIRAAALIEASIDFADEDVPVDVAPEVAGLLTALLQELRAEVVGAQMAERIRDGFEVAILGVPNAGKSTLLNKLAGREAAIVSEHAGTTRDVIEVRMDLRGLPVTLLDTAGLRPTADPVEGIGVDRGLARARAADLRIFLLSDDEATPFLDPVPGDICIRGKADLGPGEAGGVSGLTGQGVDDLIALVGERLSARAASASTLTRERHRVAAQGSIRALESALDEVDRGLARAEIVAAEIRSAIVALESLVGLVDVENLLDEIFASFCIGK